MDYSLCVCFSSWDKLMVFLFSYFFQSDNGYVYPVPNIYFSKSIFEKCSV